MTHDFWGAHLWDVERATHKSFRPVTTLLWRILVDTVGHVSPFYIRLLSCVGHSVATYLLFGVLYRLRCSSLLRLVVCMLFAAHPVHTENIVYSVGFADSLSTVFLALSLLVSLSGCGRGLALFLCTLSALSKESGFVSYLITFFIQFLRFPTHLKLYFPELVLSVIAPLARFWYVGGCPVNFAYVDVPYIYERDWIVRGLSYMHAHSVYARLALLPWNMSWDYSYDAVPLVKSVSDLRFLGGLATYTAVSALCWSAARRRSYNFCLAVALFVLPFVPASSVLVAVGTVVGERLLYPVTFGLAVVLGTCRLRQTARAMLTLLVPIYMTLAWQRVNVWSSKFSLYETDAAAWPRSCKTLHQFGAVLINRDRDAALSVLKASLQIFDDNALTDYLISQILIEKNQLAEALQVHNKIANGHGIGFTDFSRFMFLVDAGYLLVASGQVSEYPIALIEEGLEIFGWVLHGRNALAVAYLHTGSYDKAVESLKFADHICRTEGRHTSIKCGIVRTNLAVALALLGDHENAGKLLQDIVVSNESLHTLVDHNAKWLRGEIHFPRIELFYERFT